MTLGRHIRQGAGAVRSSAAPPWRITCSLPKRILYALIGRQH